MTEQNEQLAEAKKAAQQVTQAQVNTALQEIVEQYPYATPNSLATERGLPWSTPLEFLDDADFLEQVRTCVAWVQAVKVTENLRKSTYSPFSTYWIKHVVEAWGSTRGLKSYVCQMALIVALWMTPGVKLKLAGRRSINPVTNISKRVVPRVITGGVIP